MGSDKALEEGVNFPGVITGSSLGSHNIYHLSKEVRGRDNSPEGMVIRSQRNLSHSEPHGRAVSWCRSWWHTGCPRGSAQAVGSRSEAEAADL